MFKRNGIDMNFFKSLFKNNTPKPETQSFQASNLQTAISKILKFLAFDHAIGI